MPEQWVITITADAEVIPGPAPDEQPDSADDEEQQ